jgi:nitroreductase
MDFFEAVERRRSVRLYTPELVPAQVVDKAINAALLAPNSSNMQTWRIYWIKNSDKKKRLVEACLDQGAARTAAELLVFVADAASWKVAQNAIIASIEDNPRKDLHAYYKKLMPVLYGWRVLAPLKWLGFNLRGLFRPTPRTPWSSRDISEVSIKSCALACENFMLAIAAQDFDTCPMEGFDEARVRRILKLGRRARVVMVISVGRRNPRGIWGERFRLPRDKVVHTI